MPRRMPVRVKPLAALAALAAALTLVLGVLAAGGQQNAASPPKASDAAAPAVDCLACHANAMGTKKAIDKAKLDAGPHKAVTCQMCHSTITGPGPHPAAEVKQKAQCATCHPAQGDLYAKSMHAKADKKAGDHPTCAVCHSPNGDAHAVTAKPANRLAKVALCARCHGEESRMSRYGSDAEAVPSYYESFHGKALVRFKSDMNAAACTDCHGYHDVLETADPAARTSRSNVGATCGQPKCHPGAKMNFGMSGATHLRVKEKSSVVLRLEDFFFRWLTIGTMLALLAGVGLDLRVKVFSKHRAPRSGRFVGLMISISFLFLVAAIFLAYFGVAKSAWCAVAALIIMALAIVFYLARPKPPRPADETNQVPRLTIAQRIQHAGLALSFTVLVVTGMPLRFAHVPWVREIGVLMGGLPVTRVLHRGAATIMIATWIWHTIYLFYRWKRAGYSLKSWTMFPSLGDVRDFFDVVKLYLGLSHQEPKFDRFQFREKFDYFAVYWGMPVMVFSGLVLWFPITFGNLLPELGLSVAYIAHSDEAILAFLAILVWHLYNTHFNPDRFPLNPAFLTGTLSEADMAREHPLELERYRSGNLGSGQSSPTADQLEGE